MPEDVAIIGAGPAGLTAALQLKRYGIFTRIFEKTRPGGLLWNANHVENYLGFPAGISGKNLVQAFLQQIASLSIQVHPEAVLNLTWENGSYQIETDVKHYTARVVVIASGTQPRKFPVGFIPPALHGRVFYEVLPLLEMGVSARRIAIIGAGDAAFDYALNLAKQNQVVILNRSEKLKCLPLLWERASRNPAIRYYQNSSLIRLSGNDDGGVVLACQQDNAKLTLEADYLIGALGRLPELGFVTTQLTRQVDWLEAQGSLYFVGDVKNNIYRQSSIATGDGMLAAMKIYQFLKE